METTLKPECVLPIAPGSAPWLVFPNGKDRETLTFFHVSEPKKNYHKSFQEMQGKFCEASFHGWLVMLDYAADEDRCFLWNSVTRETIHLPPRKLEYRNNVLGCILSSPPTDPHCMILCFSREGRFFLFCRLGDEKWTKQDYEIVKNDVIVEDDFIFCAISFSNGIIYTQTFQRHFGVIDRDPCGRLSVRLLDVEPGELLPGTIAAESFLVESCGDFFLINVIYIGLNDNKITTIQVSKMDFSRMVWVKVESLDDRVFFLGENCSTSCSATESGIKGNCIYFTLRKDYSLYLFDLEDESVSVTLPCPHLSTHWFPSFWLVVPINRRVDTLREDEQRITEEEEKMEQVKQIKQEIIKEDKNDGETESLWFGLSLELHRLIATHLTLPLDYMNFRLVCRTWGSAAPRIRWITDLTSSTKSQSPWLMFFNREKGICNFFDPMCNITYFLETPEFLEARICCSKYGWLLMSQGERSMFFFNPFTKERIKLPDLSYNYSFDGLSFSSPPTSSYCVVFGIFDHWYDQIKVSFIRLGEKKWNYITSYSQHSFNPSPNNPVFYDEAFYCLGQEGNLGVFDLKEEKRDWTVLPTFQPCSANHQNFLVECNEEIVSVFVSNVGKLVGVFRLDHSEQFWVHVKSLEDQTLFVSRSTSLFVAAATEKMKNKIYFPRFFGNNNNVFYSLGTNRWHSSFSDNSSEDFYDTKEQLHCTWIQPSLAWTIP